MKRVKQDKLRGALRPMYFWPAVGGIRYRKDFPLPKRIIGDKSGLYLGPESNYFKTVRKNSDTLAVYNGIVVLVGAIVTLVASNGLENLLLKT
jgi:hypothetical protein